jgi:hypothetical protein
MSADTSTGSAPVAERVGDRLGRTLVAVRGALSRRDGRAVFAVTAATYLPLYLAGLAYLGLGRWGLGLSVVADPLTRTFRPVGPFQWEPIALLTAGPIELLIAPLNLLLGTVLALLVALNLAVSVVAWRGPAACRIGPGAGAVAGLPGLLSGAACCGPAILLVIGVQASAGLIAAFRWLVPVGVLALVGTLLWVAGRVDPAE